MAIRSSTSKPSTRSTSTTKSPPKSKTKTVGTANKFQSNSFGVKKQTPNAIPQRPATKSMTRTVEGASALQSTTTTTTTKHTPRNRTLAAPSLQPAQPTKETEASKPTLTELNKEVTANGPVRVGAEGPAVAELQTALNETKQFEELKIDGKFGTATENAVRQFQDKHKLNVDGAVGADTLGKLNERNNTANTTETTQEKPTETKAETKPDATKETTLEGTKPSFTDGAGRVKDKWGNTPANRLKQAEEVLRAQGKWPPEEGHAYAIQIDQDPPPASATDAEKKAYLTSYTGETSVFKGKDGGLTEVTKAPLTSAAHPGQATTTEGSPDINNDGARDIAHIRPGAYTYNTKLGGSGAERFTPSNDAEFNNVARDTNQDGTIDANEAKAKLSATHIQIHKGNTASPSSLGCQTMPPAEYDKFVSAIKDGTNQDKFTYILVRRNNDTHGANAF